MKAHQLWIVAVLALAACGGGGSSSDGMNPDGNNNGNDGEPPPPPPGKRSISGTAAEQGQGGATPTADVAIAVFDVADEATALASATSDAQGNYSLEIDDSHTDVFVKATKADFVDTFAYPAGTLSGATAKIDANMLTTNTYGLLLNFIGGSMSKGMITLNVTDAGGTAVAGATVDSSPAAGKVRYLSGGFPSGTDGTDDSGVAFLVDVPPGNATLSAMKSGSTFKSHQVNARAMTFTTTVIAP